jgi:hypothetical protein
VDRWTRQLIGQWRSGERSDDVWETLAIVAFVCAVTVWRGFAVGVAAGVLVTLIVFVRNMNRSLVRSRRTAALEPSRRVYPPRQEGFLREARSRIVLLELEGALFFGSAERLAREVDAIDAEAGYVVLDRRDAAGAVLVAVAAAWFRAAARRCDGAQPPRAAAESVRLLSGRTSAGLVARPRSRGGGCRAVAAHGSGPGRRRIELPDRVFGPVSRADSGAAGQHPAVVRREVAVDG